MQTLSGAKRSYVNRGMSDRGAVGLGGLDREPRLGDLVVARVVSVNAHDGLENVHGRRVRLYPGDVVVGAFGNRYATDYYEGYLPTGTPYALDPNDADRLWDETAQLLRADHASGHDRGRGGGGGYWP
jgi:hypothetical protein